MNTPVTEELDFNHELSSQKALEAEDAASSERWLKNYRDEHQDKDLMLVRPSKENLIGLATMVHWRLGELWKEERVGADKAEYVSKRKGDISREAIAFCDMVDSWGEHLQYHIRIGFEGLDGIGAPRGFKQLSSSWRENEDPSNKMGKSLVEHADKALNEITPKVISEFQDFVFWNISSSEWKKTCTAWRQRRHRHTHRHTNDQQKRISVSSDMHTKLESLKKELGHESWDSLMAYLIKNSNTV